MCFQPWIAAKKVPPGQQIRDVLNKQYMRGKLTGSVLESHGIPDLLQPISRINCLMNNELRQFLHC